MQEGAEGSLTDTPQGIEDGEDFLADGNARARATTLLSAGRSGWLSRMVRAADTRSDTVTPDRSRRASTLKLGGATRKYVRIPRASRSARYAGQFLEALIDQQLARKRFPGILFILGWSIDGRAREERGRFYLQQAGGDDQKS